MWHIERHIIRSVMPPILGAAVVLAVVMITFYTAQTLVDAVAEQHPLSSVAHFTLLRLGIFLDVLLPTALCLGIIMGLGQLYTHHEVTAMMASGVGPQRIFLAVLVPTLVTAILVAASTLSLRPQAFKTLYDLESRLAIRIDFDRVEPGRFVSLGSSWLVYARERTDDSLVDVLVQHRGERETELLRAGFLHREEGEGQLRLIFSDNVEHYRFEPGGTPRLLGHFDALDVVLEPPEAPEQVRMRRAYSMSSLRTSDNPDYVAEWQWRVVAPLSTLVLAMASVPLSRVNPRQGRGSRALAGVLMIVVYFSVLGTAMHWVESARVPTWIGVWWVPGLLALGCLLLWGVRWLRGRRP